MSEDKNWEYQLYVKLNQKEHEIARLHHAGDEMAKTLAFIKGFLDHSDLGILIKDKIEPAIQEWVDVGFEKW